MCLAEAAELKVRAEQRAGGRWLRPSATETGPDALEALHVLAAAQPGCGRAVRRAAAEAVCDRYRPQMPWRRYTPALGLQAGVFGAKADILFLMSDYQQ